MKPGSVPQNDTALLKQLTCLTCKSASAGPVLGKARAYLTLFKHVLNQDQIGWSKYR